MAECIRTVERRIVLVGKTGNGKSATGNTILRKELFKFEVSSHSARKSCQKEETRWKGRKVEVVGTPGFFNNANDRKPEARKPKEYAEKVKKGLKLCSPGPYIILQDRMEGKTLKQFVHEEPSLRAQAFQREDRYLAFNHKAKGGEAQVAQVMTMIDGLVQKNRDARYYMLEEDKKEEKEEEKKSICCCLF